MTTNGRGHFAFLLSRRRPFAAIARGRRVPRQGVSNASLLCHLASSSTLRAFLTSRQLSWIVSRKLLTLPGRDKHRGASVAA